MSDIVLTAGVRSNLLNLQQTASLMTTVQDQLATGRKVNSALDNPISYFTSQSLTNRANSLNSLLDSMSNAFQTIQAANNGITSITKLVQSAQALVSQAQQTADTTVRASLSTQFNAVLTQIDQLAGDSGFNGINLLAGNNLTVTLDETGTSSVTITGVADSTTALSLNNATNNWAGAGDLTTASTALTAALTTLQSQAQSFGTNLSTVQIRQDFTKSMVDTLQTGSDNLTLADSNQAGADLLALQTRQQLSTTALSLASQASQSVLRLFG